LLFLTTHPKTNKNSEFGNAISADVSSLSIGIGLIVVYSMVMLGNVSCFCSFCEICFHFIGCFTHVGFSKRPFVWSRVLLALGAILCVGLGILVSFGLASAFGIFYGPVQVSRACVATSAYFYFYF
jgi:hypothetical protein